MNAYQQRSIILKTLGFETYADYLDSDLWAWIRERAMRRNNGKCYCCDRPAESIHHFKYTYENLSGRDLDWLTPICVKCHKHGETYKDGSKVWEIEVVNERLGALRARYHKPSKERPFKGPQRMDAWEVKFRESQQKEKTRRETEERRERELSESLALSKFKSFKVKNENFIDSLPQRGGTFHPESMARLGNPTGKQKKWKKHLSRAPFLLSESTPEMIKKWNTHPETVIQQAMGEASTPPTQPAN